MKETTFESLQSTIGKEYHCSGHALGDHREGLGDVYAVVKNFNIELRPNYANIEVLLSRSRDTDRLVFDSYDELSVSFEEFKLNFVESPTELQFTPDMSIDEIHIDEPECK